jgi:hypothetical protein
VEEGRPEIAGLESRSRLIMGDFHRWAGHEGRWVWQEALNVGFSAFHEGCGAGKTDPLGGHDLVSRKKIVTGKSIVDSDRGRDSCDLGYLLRAHVLLRVKGASLMVGRVNL